MCRVMYRDAYQYVIDIGTDMHSFRHSMRDRLSAVNCPSEMIDQIGGWSKRPVGEGYGEGFSAASTMNFMQKIAP